MLTLLFDARQPLTTEAVGHTMRITRGAAYQLLRQLETLSFVTRDRRGLWCLPPGGVMTLSGTLIARLNLRAAARPIIENIAARTGETVSLNVRNRDHRMRVDVVEGHPPHPSLPVGEALPLHSGASGKVLLAFLARPLAAPVLARAAAERADTPSLRGQLAGIRRRGYLAARSDRLPRVAALSVPVFGPAGVAAAITVVGPEARWSSETMTACAAWMLPECKRLSAALGSLPVGIS